MPIYPPQLTLPQPPPPRRFHRSTTRGRLQSSVNRAARPNKRDNSAQHRPVLPGEPGSARRRQAPFEEGRRQKRDTLSRNSGVRQGSPRLEGLMRPPDNPPRFSIGGFYPAAG